MFRVWGWGVVWRIWFERVMRLLRDENVVLSWLGVGRGGGGGGGGS